MFMIPTDSGIKAFLTSFNFLTQEEIENFEEKLRPKKIKKGDFFIQEGSTCHEVGFVTSGVLRSYYYSSNGEEITYCFTFPHSFVSAYSSFLSQSKTAENIQALTEVDLWSISKNDLGELEQLSTNWLRLFKHIAEQEYIKMEKRIFILQKEAADKRYTDLLENQPELLQKIPLQYLSSYLGITPRHLSRIRSALSK
jgi:CRP-like cAMP-binding protein